MSTLAPEVLELDFNSYQSRQYREVTPAGLLSRAAKIAPGEKFRLENNQWQPVPYVGHAVVSMLSGFPENRQLANHLHTVRSKLDHAFPDGRTLYLLPEASYHQTVANTLSDDRHERLVVQRGLAERYPSLVTGVFSDFVPVFASRPLAMQMVGISIFGTSLGLLGVFENEEDFGRVVHFRNSFYAHSQIASLGITRTRPFIGHLTVAYIERPLSESDRARLVEVALEINRGLAVRNLPFFLPHAELRAYAHLAEFRQLPGLPAYQF